MILIKGAQVKDANDFDKDYSEKYKYIRDPMYLKLYKLVRKGVETIEKSYKIEYIKYD